MAAKKSSSSKRSGVAKAKRTTAKPKRPALRTVAAKKAGKAPEKLPAGDPGAAFCQAVESALKRGKPEAIGDEALRRVMTAAVRIYAAKVEEAGYEIAPFRDNSITATETVVAACAMIRAADLNLFDVAMWFRRPVATEQQ
jgi:hypothetical protein